MNRRPKLILLILSVVLLTSVGTARAQNASQISSGQFGANAGLGDFSFPSHLSVGTTDTLDPLSTPTTLLSSKLLIADGPSRLSFRDHASGNPWLLLSTTVGSTAMQGIFHLNMTDGVVVGSVTKHSFTLRSFNINRLTIDPSGYVGIGTQAPGTFFRMLDGGVDQPVILGLASASGAKVGFSAPNAANADLYFAQPNTSAHSIATSLIRGSMGTKEATLETGNLLFYTKPAAGSVAEVMRIDSSGNVGIGVTNPQKRLDVNGDINVSGNINAKYQDLAEWVPAAAKMLPGTVVVVSAGKQNEVTSSTHAYDTAVAGVVSAQPGITLGEASDSKAKIATTGRVKVHVIAGKYPIRAGDLLVTSDKPGTAMRSVPVKIGGTAFHRPGTLIGKALEPIDSGEGDILVLLSLQ